MYLFSIAPRHRNSQTSCSGFEELQAATASISPLWPSPPLAQTSRAPPSPGPHLTSLLFALVLHAQAADEEYCTRSPQSPLSPTTSFWKPLWLFPSEEGAVRNPRNPDHFCFKSPFSQKSRRGVQHKVLKLPSPPTRERSPQETPITTAMVTLERNEVLSPGVRNEKAASHRN